MTAPETPRERARRLLAEHAARGDATGWFEAVYAAADGRPDEVQWADLAPNPHVVQWLDRETGLDREPAAGAGRRALDVGCGLGDTAEHLAARGFAVDAFDVSQSAVAWCRRRFPGSAVAYRAADLLDPPPEWRGAFDLVVEVYTLQVLPPALRRRAQASLAGLLAPGGRLLVVCRGREPAEPEGQMPWPLTVAELAAFDGLGLARESFEDFLDDEDPPVRRLRAVWRLI